MQISKIIVLALLCCPAWANAENKNTTEDDDKGIFNIVVENDKFGGSDQDYTNGIRFSWISSEDKMPSWASSVANMLPLASNGKERVSIAAGQNMYTPEDTSLSTPIAGEHPYAGWLYGSVGIVSDTGKTLDNVMLTVGVVGPWALAKETQNTFHAMIHDDKSKGWDNQLNNEPGVVLTYERKWKEFFELSKLGMQADIMPHVGVNLGNVSTDATIGTTFRLGFDLPADYGPPRIRPSLPGSDFFVPTENWGAYLFTTVGERAVARNIFLDGNTFSNSQSVDKENFVGSIQVGAVATYGDTRLSYSQVFMTKEYETQAHASEFGTITLSQRF